MSPTIQFVIDHLPLHFLGSAFIGVVGWGVKSLSDMAKSVQDLNVKIAIGFERMESHEVRIGKLEKRKIK